MLWSLTSRRAKRISCPKKFRSSAGKEFFNTIGAKRTFASCQCRVSATYFRTHAVQQNRYFAQRLKPVFSVHAPLVSPRCVAMGARLESFAHLMIADPIADAVRTVANI